MTPHRIRHHRIFLQAGLMASVMLMGPGCVSTDTHQKALDELEKAKKASASQAAELEALRKKSKAESDQMQQQVAGLQQNLDQETSQRKSAEQQAASLEKEREAALQKLSDLKATDVLEAVQLPKEEKDAISPRNFYDFSTSAFSFTNSCIRLRK